MLEGLARQMGPSATVYYDPGLPTLTVSALSLRAADYVFDKGIAA